MRVIEQSITAFTSINVKDTYSEWSAATTYAFSNYVRYGNDDYYSIVDSNLNNTPSLNNGKWMRWSASNKYAMLNPESEDSTICNYSTVSSGTDYNLTFTVSVGSATWCAIKRAVGNSMKILEKNSGGTIIRTHLVEIAAGQKVNGRDYAFALQPTTETISIAIYELEIGGYSSIKDFILGIGYYFGDAKFGLRSEVTRVMGQKRYPDGIRTYEAKNELQESTIELTHNSIKNQENIRTSEYFVDKPLAFVADETDGSTIESVIKIGYFDVYSSILSTPSKSYSSISVRELP